VPVPSSGVSQSIRPPRSLTILAVSARPSPLPETARSEDLDDRTLLLLEEGHCLRDHALAACSLPGLDPTRSILGTSLHTLVQMVDTGLGMTLLPKMAIEGGILNGTRVRTVPLAGDAPSRTIGLVWRKNSPREAGFRLLAEESRAG